MKKQERLMLIDSLIDGSIREADRLRIEAELIVDSEVRRDYYQRVQLAVLLEREAAEMPALVEPKQVDEQAFPEQPGAARWPRFLARSVLAVAASLLIVMAASRGILRSNDNGPALTERPTGTSKSPAEVSASGFAVLNGQDGAIWSGATFSEGDLMPSGQLHLTSGLAHIELFSGVQVVLEGNALFTIDSPMQITMVKGVARAHVPEAAQGFRIRTSSGDVVDLGTEFSVNVDQGGADVHVIDGEVELQSRESDLLRLQAGESLRLTEPGGVVDAHRQTTRTVGPIEFQDLVRAKQQRRYAQWADWQDTVQSDPRLIAHYRFHSDRPQARLIENLAQGEAAASDGTIVAARRATDRWNRSEGAIDFSPIGSRIRVDVPGEHRGLTLICRVKINSLDRWYNSLFLTDGHEDHEPHWQLMDDGRIFFSVKVPQEGNTKGEQGADHVQPVFYSPSIWTPSISGRWMMLAVTYDVDRQEVTHFLNGQPISSEQIPAQQLVESIRIGQASLGNWSEPMYRTDPKFVLRNLNGTMDEFAIFSTALSADEIMHWYESGNPNE